MRENFLEEAFLLQYHLKMPYSNIRDLPLPYRRWFIERLSSEFKKRADDQKKSSDDTNNIADVPMGEIYQQLGLNPSDASTDISPPQTSQGVSHSQGRTLKFNKE